MQIQDDAMPIFPKELFGGKPRTDIINKLLPIDQFQFICAKCSDFGASDISFEPVPYESTDFDSIVRIKVQKDGDWGYRFDRISKELKENPNSYILMREYANFVRALKNATGHLETNETKIPQDGAFEFGFGNGETKEKIKVRMSFFPTIVNISEETNGTHPCTDIRIIKDDVRFIRPMDDISLLPSDYEMMDGFLHKLQKAIILSGPTGHGKSSSIHSYIKHLQKKKGDSIKIVAIENPVEYKNPGIIQGQISPGGLTWSGAMSAFMRQSPQVIMVGEIRELSEAKTFIDISLSGHMGITSIHADSAVDVFERLIQMGIEKDVILGGVGITASQRLIPRVCMHCSVQVADPTVQKIIGSAFDRQFGNYDFSKLSAKDICFLIHDDKFEYLDKIDNDLNLLGGFKSLKNQFNDYLRTLSNEERMNSELTKEKFSYKSKKEAVNIAIRSWLRKVLLSKARSRRVTEGTDKECPHCVGKGVNGRIGIFEFVKTTDAIQALISDGGTANKIKEYVFSSGVFTLRRYGIARLMRGEIGFENFKEI